MNCIISLSVIRMQNNVRLFHTSLRFAGLAKAMKKVMDRSSSKTKKFKYYETPMPSTPTAFSKGLYEGSQSRNSRRANVLNKLFMRYITDLMAAGENSSYFVGHGIEVSRVQISPDFTCVNIYWITRGTKKDEVIDEILRTHVGSLRHELAQLKVVGVIPKLQFVKDKQYAMTAEVDRLLSIADFGDDYVPIDVATRLTTQLELNTTLDSHTINKIQSLDNTDDDNENTYEESIPVMPQNVFNLNHSEIMERIIKSKKKSQVPQRLAIENESDGITRSVNEDVIKFANEREERDAFRNFLYKRQILKDKSTKVDKNYRPELEYLREEWLEQQKQDHNVPDMFDERDYIDDEIEEK